MFANRLYTLGLFLFWSAAMTWLVMTKVAPAMRGGDRPRYVTLPAEVEADPITDCWSVNWGEREVGWAANMFARQEDGVAQVESLLHFEELPLGEMLTKMFGPAARVIQPLVGEGDSIDIPMTIHSRMMFNSLDQLSSFDTWVDMAEDQRLAHLRGTINDGRMRLRVRIGSAAVGEDIPDLTREMVLPPDALVVDGLTPQSHLLNLWVGQTWTVRTYRPFPPTNPVQLIEGRVEQLTQLEWQGEMVETFLVVYREDAGAGITATREPISRIWVRRDGQVLRQQFDIGGEQFVLARMPDEECRDRRELLERLMNL